MDNSGHVVAVLAGRARGNFEDALLEATCIFERNSLSLLSAKEDALHGKKLRRGNFHALVTGISYGGGQTVRAPLLA